jgi:H+/gluconate symporter-like permease
LNTSPYAGWEVSLIAAIFLIIFGYWRLKRMIAKAVANGEHFIERDTGHHETRTTLPHPGLSLIPLLVVTCPLVHIP